MLQQLRREPAARAVLDERARALAIEERDAEAAGGEATLTFALGGNRYSLPAGTAREVQTLGDYTPLPGAPAFVVGLMNVRGRLITGIDLRPLLDLAATTPSAESLLLIVGGAGAEIGLLADTVLEVRRRSFTLSPTPSAAAGRSAAWVRGVDEDLSLHLDPSLLLSYPRLIVNDEGDQ